MKKLVLTVCLVGLFSLGTTVAAFAQAGHEAHHPQAAEEPAAAPQPMGMMGMGGMPCGMMGGGMPGKGMGMMPGMGGMGGMMCPMCAKMMGGGTAGMMEGMEEMHGMGMMPGMGTMGMMDRPFFLDRAKDLGLSDEQERKLRVIRRAARTDNIRTAAELRIARLELLDLLAGEWTVETAEKLVRNAQKLQGDMKVRFLKAKKESEKVLTPEQLQMARGGEVELEELFR